MDNWNCCSVIKLLKQKEVCKCDTCFIAVVVNGLVVILCLFSFYFPITFHLFFFFFDKMSKNIQTKNTEHMSNIKQMESCKTPDENDVNTFQPLKQAGNLDSESLLSITVMPWSLTCSLLVPTCCMVNLIYKVGLTAALVGEPSWITPDMCSGVNADSDGLLAVCLCSPRTFTVADNTVYSQWQTLAICSHVTDFILKLHYLQFKCVNSKGLGTGLIVFCIYGCFLCPSFI